MQFIPFFSMRLQ